MRHVFITPIDREDFFLLTSTLDDCVDDVQDVVLSLKLYHAGIGWELPLRMSEILIEMSNELIILFRLLKDIDKNETEIGNVQERSIRWKVKAMLFTEMRFQIFLTVPMKSWKSYGGRKSWKRWKIPPIVQRRWET